MLVKEGYCYDKYMTHLQAVRVLHGESSDDA
jgi:hypothetical protein